MHRQFMSAALVTEAMVAAEDQYYQTIKKSDPGWFHLSVAT